MKSDISGNICFKRDDFHLYVFLLFVVIIYLLFILKKSKEDYTDVDLNSNLTKNELVNKINKLQDDLFTCKTSKQKCMIDLQKSQSTLSNSRGFTENVTQRANLNKIYNPLVSPGRAYVYKNDSFQQLGFIFNDSDRYPLYGRPKYSGRSDRYEYYIIDETRNRLKIPYKSKNDYELSDGDKIFIDVLNNEYNVKIYDYDEFRYDPDVL
jgi:hypothetical protein